MAGTALAGTALAGTFGTRVQIGGQAADLALDEPRGVLYVADFTRNSIEIVSLAANQVVNSISVDPNPSSISISPNGRWLLVAHFGNNTLPAPPDNVLTLIDLANQYVTQKFHLTDPPLGLAFGNDNLALVVTTRQFLLFDPQQGFVSVLNTTASVSAKALPAPADSFPADITTASVAASADGTRIYGMGNSTGTFTFSYDVPSQTVSPGGVVLSSGVLGPRVVSLNQDGSLVMVGWLMIDSSGTFVNYLPHHSDQFSVGTNAFDNQRGLVYAHIPAKKGDAPVLQILATSNLTLVDRLKLTENTTGKSVLTSDASVLYSISDSGVLVLPVGNLNASPRLAASATDLFFRGNFCDRAPASQKLTISDPGGGKTPFTITSSDPNVTVSPSSGTTPATVTVTVDPNAFLSRTGTSTATLTLSSSTAINLPPTVRVLINVAKPEQRGTLLNIPGTLVDLLADPVRNRYYVLRQDNNTVLIFDASNNTRIATLSTNNVPTSLAITADNNLLLVGHHESQTLAVFDLNSLQAQPYIQTGAGGGHTVRSLAVSSGKILAGAVDYKNIGHVLSIDLNARAAIQLATLGDWENKISTDAVVVASPDQSKIMVAGSDGNVFLYDAGVDTFTISRQDVSSLSGAYAAGNGVYMAGNNILDAELAPVASLDASAGRSSGFAFIDGFAAWTLAPDSASAGVMERVDFGSGTANTVTSTVEAPLLTTPLLDFAPSVFTRTLAPLSNGTAIVSLTTSGVTIQPINFDAPVAQPVLTSVVSAADGVSPVASGGLLTVFGSGLSSAPLAASQFPLPGVLGNSCLTFNDQSIPLLLVSFGQINAQAPLVTGNGNLVLHVPGAVSDPFNLTIQPEAPALFMNAGPAANLPVIIREDDNLLVTASHPVHHGDRLLIYLTGLGVTSPVVAAGLAAPSDPLAQVQTPVTATLGGVGLSVLSANLIPGMAGTYQVSVSVPNNVPLGLGVPLTITQGGVSITVRVRVVN